MYSVKRLFKIAAVMAIATLFVASFVLPLAAQEASKMPPDKPPVKITPPAPIVLPLNGKIFDGSLQHKGVSEKPMAESISFKDGMLISAYFAPMGYTSCPYTAKKVKGKITFTASSKSDKDPTTSIQWNGSVVKDKTTTAVRLTAAIKVVKPGMTEDYLLTAVEQEAATPPAK